MRAGARHTGAHGRLRAPDERTRNATGRREIPAAGRNARYSAALPRFALGMNALSSSIGTGKMVVLLFSVAISLSVCR